jgi:LL-diaminopimelate aminotransferase
MFLPVQLAAAKALSLGQDWYDSVNGVYRARRIKVFELLELLQCDFSRDQVGMFVWAKIPATYKDGYELSDRVLHGAAVFITPGGIFGPAGQGYVRVSLCSTGEKLQESIERVRGAGLCSIQ